MVLLHGKKGMECSRRQKREIHSMLFGSLQTAIQVFFTENDQFAYITQSIMDWQTTVSLQNTLFSQDATKMDFPTTIRFPPNHSH
jgi:hypothetical protein